MENYPLLPSKLSAGLYGVLAQLKSVHLDHTTDLAGKKVLGLDVVVEGYLKEEILIDPATYAYAGQVRVAVRAHTNVALDETVTIKKGELLDDEAILRSAVVNSAGQR
jgi:hypothetical protein